MSEYQNTAFRVYPIKVDLGKKNPLKTVNFYLLSLDDQLILFDAGWNDQNNWEAFQNTLKHHGFTMKDLTAVVISHNHIDHCGLVNRIVETHDIPVFAHQIAIPRLKRDPDFLQMRINFFHELYERFDCGDRGKRQVDYLVESLDKNHDAAIQPSISAIEKAQLQLLEILHFPGHAPDQIGLWAQESNILFGADVLLQHISSNALVEPDGNGKRLPTLHQSVQSLNKIASLPVELVYSGHGADIRDPHGLIKKRLQRIEEKGEKIRVLIQNGAVTGRDIAQSYYGKTYDQQFSLVMSEIIGQLDYLEQKGKVTKIMMNGAYRYSVI
ncbi:MBL fold metallo-hydrolase [Halobacillus sp. Marseille-Q1614]|uniref:MBL fold metallo-hydrolase n=1 Tax=Halobacillus sp. Marseille-Q1614 TaxID=2709134 RepID=UPI001570DD59|nr:MBL fold metallo-hydrolase [Halobacillus sp. Marseille-Q1614]